MWVTDLLEAFRSECDVQLRIDAAHRLVGTGDAVVIEALREGLDDENLTIREVSNALMWKFNYFEGACITGARNSASVSFASTG